MMTIYILGFHNAFAHSLMGLMDIFLQADRFLRTSGPSSERGTAGRGGTAGGIAARFVTVDGEPIQCRNRILLPPHASLSDLASGLEPGDVFIITSIHDVDDALARDNTLTDWLVSQHRRGAVLASVCTGAFLLARTGLLDGREATTHWTMADRFRQRYPAVKLARDKSIVNNGNILCAAGGSTGRDLAFYLLEKRFGHRLAADTAKFFIHDFGRSPGQAYTVFGKNTDHGDRDIRDIQHWIIDHLGASLRIGELAGKCHMTRRTFERRFKRVTGESPSAWIQQTRVEAAKQLLETTVLNFDEIAFNLGYGNAGSFRKIFSRWAGHLPSQYRARFRAGQDTLP